jgi:tyrosyl-tRNA synthetase
MNFLDELRWRGMLHDVMPGTEELLSKEKIAGYIGFDPTADSLHIGNLVQIMILVHFQRAGHTPFALVGGATGMVGDPSGKSEERKFLDETTLLHNQNCVKNQLAKFLDFSGENAAVIVNNYDWFKNFQLLDFLRQVGKHITVNYMSHKDSVKKRIETGISFTEFSYQLIQGYDFYHLWKNHNIRLQMGGSDQWGNITTGTELIRRMDGGEAFAATTPLITKADGSKFGKTESGNVWLDSAKTSPYAFYQYWINAGDEDAEKYIKIFTLMGQAEVQSLIDEHRAAPHLRTLQRALAEDITARVHGAEAVRQVQEATEILFGKDTEDRLGTLSEAMLLSVFEGVPQAHLPKSMLDSGVSAIDLLTDLTQFFPSKGEARKMIQGGGVAVNRKKVSSQDQTFSVSDTLNGKYLLVQKGKKNYCLIIFG